MSSGNNSIDFTIYREVVKGCIVLAVQPSWRDCFSVNACIINNKHGVKIINLHLFLYNSLFYEKYAQENVSSLFVSETLRKFAHAIYRDFFNSKN